MGTPGPPSLSRGCRKPAGQPCGGRASEVMSEGKVTVQEGMSWARFLSIRAIGSSRGVSTAARSPAHSPAPSCSESFGQLCGGETESQGLRACIRNYEGSWGRERRPRRQSLSSICHAASPVAVVGWMAGGSLGVVVWAWSRNRVLPAGASPEATATAGARGEAPSPCTGTGLRHGVGSGNVRAPALTDPWSAQLGASLDAGENSGDTDVPRPVLGLDGQSVSPSPQGRGDTSHSSIKGT